MSLTAGRFQETPILETLILDGITEEQLENSLDWASGLWIQLGGEGILPGRKIKLRDGVRLTLVGISVLEEVPEQIRERIARFEDVLRLYKDFFL